MVRSSSSVQVGGVFCTTGRVEPMRKPAAATSRTMTQETGTMKRGKRSPAAPSTRHSRAKREA